MKQLSTLLTIASICLAVTKAHEKTVSLTLEYSSFLLLGSKIVFKPSLSDKGVALPISDEKTYHYLFGDYFGKLKEKQYSVLYTLDTKETRICQFGQFTEMTVKEGIITFAKGPCLDKSCPGQQINVSVSFFDFINSYFLLHLNVECVSGKSEVKDAALQAKQEGASAPLDNGIKVDHQPIQGAAEVKSMV